MLETMRPGMPWRAKTSSRKPDGSTRLAARQVLDDPALRAALATAGRHEVQRYRWSSVRTELLSAYADALRMPKVQAT